MLGNGVASKGKAGLVLKIEVMEIARDLSVKGIK